MSDLSSNRNIQNWIKDVQTKLHLTCPKTDYSHSSFQNFRFDFKFTDSIINILSAIYFNESLIASNIELIEPLLSELFVYSQSNNSLFGLSFCQILPAIMHCFLVLQRMNTFQSYNSICNLSNNQSIISFVNPKSQKSDKSVQNVFVKIQYLLICIYNLSNASRPENSNCGVFRIPNLVKSSVYHISCGQSLCPSNENLNLVVPSISKSPSFNTMGSATLNRIKNHISAPSCTNPYSEINHSKVDMSNLVFSFKNLLKDNLWIIFEQILHRIFSANLSQLTPLSLQSMCHLVQLACSRLDSSPAQSKVANAEVGPLGQCFDFCVNEFFLIECLTPINYFLLSSGEEISYKTLIMMSNKAKLDCYFRLQMILNATIKTWELSKRTKHKSQSRLASLNLRDAPINFKQQNPNNSAVYAEEGKGDNYLERRSSIINNNITFSLLDDSVFSLNSDQKNLPNDNHYHIPSENSQRASFDSLDDVEENLNNLEIEHLNSLSDIAINLEFMLSAKDRSNASLQTKSNSKSSATTSANPHDQNSSSVPDEYYYSVKENSDNYTTMSDFDDISESFKPIFEN